jgi:hypothetical protein
MKLRTSANAAPGLFICVLAWFSWAHAADKKPAWIDTVPPVVRIDPGEAFQSKVFHAALSMNEQGTIWVKVIKPARSKGPDPSMETYRGPILVTEEGSTVLYYYAEDLVGNKSRVDSMKYVLDTRPPEISVSPPDRGRGAVEREQALQLFPAGQSG